MELRAGYKQTEVGVIPEEWEVATLSAVSREPMQNGIFYKPSLKGVGVKLINVGDLYVRAPIDSDTLELFDATEKERERFKVEDGDLFFTRSSIVPAGIAYCNIYRTQKIEPVVFDSHVIRMRPDTKKVVPSYLFRLCVASVARRYLVSHAKTATMTTIDQGVLGKCPVILPSLPEQCAIAAALSDVDALLAKLDQLIVKKRDIKQAAMQQLLTGKQRLPGFSGEWEVKRLGEVGNCLRGVTYKGDSDLSPYDTAHTKRLLRSNNVQNAKVVTTDIQFVNDTRVSEHQLLRDDDILICMANGSKALVGKAGMFKVSDGYEYTFGAFMGCFRSNSVESNSSFVFFLFQIGRYRNYINNLLAGSSINNLSPSSIESLEFSIPPLPEQTAIAAVLSDMDAEIAALEARRDKTRNLKQGMMQELLTGRIRLA